MLEKKQLVVDGKFGKNTAKAFMDASNMIKRHLANSEKRAKEIDEQIAREEAYRNSSAVRAEQPRRDMFSGVNLGIPDYMQPEDYENNTPKIVAIDYLGRPIYQ